MEPQREGGLQTLTALKYRTLHEIDAICSDYIYISEDKVSFKLTEIKELLYSNTFFETLLKLNRVNVSRTVYKLQKFTI